MTDESVVSTRSLFIPLNVVGPVPVEDGTGKPLGSASVVFADGGLKAEVFLDKQRPETFDLDIDPARARIALRGNLDAEGLLLIIVIDT